MSLLSRPSNSPVRSPVSVSYTHLVRIEANGEGEVTAGSIQQDAEIEILNPDWHIATLDEGAKLVMELTFDKGRGYVPADRNKQNAEFATLGAIAVDLSLIHILWSASSTASRPTAS